MTFTVRNLKGEKFLVRGTDSEGTQGVATLYSPLWARVLDKRRHVEASEVFDEAVQTIYGPLLEAAELASRIAHPSDNGLSTVIVSEGVEGVEPVGFDLTSDSNAIILNAIDLGREDLLVWVTPTQLEVFDD